MYYGFSGCHRYEVSACVYDRVVQAMLCRLVFRNRVCRQHEVGACLKEVCHCAVHGKLLW